MSQLINNIDYILLIKIFVGGLAFGFGFYYARYVKPLLMWIKGGIEDGDGVLQNKELQVFFFSLMAMFVILSIAFLGITYPDSLIYSVFLAATGMYASKQFAQKMNGNGEDK